MSARNMVRNLRDSGAFDAKPPRSSWASGLLFFVGALALGALAYLGFIYVLPHAARLMEKQPVPVSYARPGVEAAPTSQN